MSEMKEKLQKLMEEAVGNGQKSLMQSEQMKAQAHALQGAAQAYQHVIRLLDESEAPAPDSPEDPDDAAKTD